MKIKAKIGMNFLKKEEIGIINYMKLKNVIKITGLYKGRSKFEMFSDLQVDDLIELSIEIEHITRRRSTGLSATYVKFKKLNNLNMKTFECSITEATRYLGNMQFVEI